MGTWGNPHKSPSPCIPMSYVIIQICVLICHKTHTHTQISFILTTGNTGSRKSWEKVSRQHGQNCGNFPIFHYYAIKEYTTHLLNNPHISHIIPAGKRKLHFGNPLLPWTFPIFSFSTNYRAAHNESQRWQLTTNFRCFFGTQTWNNTLIKRICEHQYVLVQICLIYRPNNLVFVSF